MEPLIVSVKEARRLLGGMGNNKFWALAKAGCVSAYRHQQKTICRRLVDQVLRRERGQTRNRRSKSAQAPPRARLCGVRCPRKGGLGPHERSKRGAAARESQVSLRKPVVAVPGKKGGRIGERSGHDGAAVGHKGEGPRRGKEARSPRRMENAET